MSDSQPVELVAGIGLIGHDGWADGRYGDYERSMVTMLDFKLIQDLAGLNKLDRWRMLKSLADQAAAHIQVVLPQALEQFEYVYLITHVPPLREACWYEGSISDDEWAPHFTCKAMGEVILKLMRARPDRHLTVLCGHTHGSGQIRPLPNLRILTGGALYGYPSFAGVFALCQEPSHWR
jgi:hypothetical protein